MVIMKYYKYNSIPLVEEFPGIGETSFDQYGNLVKIDMFNEPIILSKTILNDDTRIDDYDPESFNIHNEIFLKGFWAWTTKSISGYEVSDAD